MSKRLEVKEGTKTFKTVANLDKALEKYGFQDLAHILVYTADGRVTAVFVDKDANPVIFRGFMWVFGW
jgi:hypothetical protein